MNAKRFALLVAVAFLGGVVGGIASHRLMPTTPVFATGFEGVNQLKADVVEAKEFRVVDARGWLLARIHHHDNSEPSVASIDFIDGKPGRKNRLQLSIQKDSIKLFNEKEEVVWSAP